MGSLATRAVYADVVCALTFDMTSSHSTTQQALTEEQMLILDLNTISFIGVVASGDEEIIAVIEADDRLAQNNCYFWACTMEGTSTRA